MPGVVTSAGRATSPALTLSQAAAYIAVLKAGLAQLVERLIRN